MDDKRTKLPPDNAFRYLAPEATPAIPEGYSAPLELKTASQIEDERLAAKRFRGWMDMSNAPKTGERFLAIVGGVIRVVAWGKTSHVPLYGFCLADQGVEDFDICKPIAWQPMPPLPDGEPIWLEGAMSEAQIGR